MISCGVKLVALRCTGFDRVDLDYAKGKIGQCFIDICKGFGTNVLVNTPNSKRCEGVEYVSLDEMYERADIISLHCRCLRIMYI